jgi:hypothetical protein
MNRFASLAGLLLLGAITAFAADGPGSTPDAHRLGLNESMLKYCSSLDPDDAAKLRQRIGDLWHGASGRQMDRVRHSDAYKTAYQSVTDFVAKVDDRNARLACMDAVNGRRK